MDELLRLLVSVAVLFLAVGLGLRALLGKTVYEDMMGTLAADVVRFLFLFPFRVLRWLARLLRLIP